MYYKVLRHITRTVGETRRVRKRCCRCGIHFFTSWSNRKRKDLMCPFGCRKEREREQGNKRGIKHYRTPKGRQKKSERNRKRSLLSKQMPKVENGGVLQERDLMKGAAQGVPTPVTQMTVALTSPAPPSPSKLSTGAKSCERETSSVPAVSNSNAEKNIDPSSPSLLSAEVFQYISLLLQLSRGADVPRNELEAILKEMLDWAWMTILRQRRLQDRGG